MCFQIFSFSEVKFSLFLLAMVVFKDSEHVDAAVECDYPDRA